MNQLYWVDLCSEECQENMWNVDREHDTLPSSEDDPSTQPEELPISGAEAEYMHPTGESG